MKLLAALFALLAVLCLAPMSLAAPRPTHPLAGKWYGQASTGQETLYISITVSKNGRLSAQVRKLEFGQLKTVGTYKGTVDADGHVSGAFQSRAGYALTIYTFAPDASHADFYGVVSAPNGSSAYNHERVFGRVP